MTSDSSDFRKMEDKFIFNSTLRDRLILVYLNAVGGWCSNIKNVILCDSLGTLDQILDEGKGSGTLDKILSLTTNSSMGNWLQRKHLDDGQKVNILPNIVFFQRVLPLLHVWGFWAYRFFELFRFLSVTKCM